MSNWLGTLTMRLPSVLQLVDTPGCVLRAIVIEIEMQPLALDVFHQQPGVDPQRAEEPRIAGSRGCSL